MTKKPLSETGRFDYYESLIAVAGRRPDWSRHVSIATALLGEQLSRAWSSVATIAGALGRRLTPFLAATSHDAVGAMRSLSKLTLGRRALYGYTIVVMLMTIASAVFAFLVAGSTFAFYSSDIANPTVLLNKKNTGTTILDRNDKILYQVYGASHRQLVPLESLPKSLVNATLAAEDPEFYNHPGFSWRATARALYTDVTERSRAQGGSTITQQLVKNTLLSPDKSFVRKFQEILLASELERRYSKDQIMQMYLNEVYYGQGAYGIESAAQTYFHKAAKDLSVSESVLMAGLPLGPSRFDPNIAPTEARERRNFLLQRMEQLGYLTTAERTAAEAEVIQASSRQVELHAPHFVFYVLNLLREEYGNDMVERGGITVSTTLDLPQQENAQRIVAAQVDRLNSHHVSNGGLIAVDSSSGEIQAMVGSIDYNQPQFGNVNVTLSQLQPGSSFKPMAYATAFKKGWNGATMVEDKPLRVPNGDGTIYEPKNYDLRFHGRLNLRRALANSFNIPAVEVLRFAGIHDTIQTAHAMGITTLNDESRYGLSLVLGGGEVRPLDMAGVYATFANGGSRINPKAISKVLDRNGAEITRRSNAPTGQVIDARIAYMITHILSDNKARTEMFGANSPLKLSRPAAAKTGTTNDYRDNWTAGYTPDLTTVVWVGNNDHTPMNNVDGITGSAPIWHDFMEQSLAGKPAKPFVPPDGVVIRKICADGGLARPGTTSATDEVFLADAIPTRQCGGGPKTDGPTPVEENRGPNESAGPAQTETDEPMQDNPPEDEVIPPDETQ